MSTLTAKRLSQTALSTTLTTALYTVPASTSTIVKEIVLCNTDSVSRTVTLYAGNGTTVAQTILAAKSLVAGETFILSLSTVLATADTISGGASVGSMVSCTISGVEIV
jgi:hypothetical protein